MMQFHEVLDRFYAAHEDDAVARGTSFEELIRRWFITDLRYKDKVKNIWRWGDFPYRDSVGGHDLGIDLVIRTHDDEYWAVQCKFYREDALIAHKEVAKFLAAAGMPFTDQRGQKVAYARLFWVATCDLNPNADTLLRAFDPAVTRINVTVLEDSHIDWERLYQGMIGAAARLNAEKQPFPHQREAVDRAEKFFGARDRGQLIMACGTGKTYTALLLAERLLPSGQAGTAVFFVPSIALLSQTVNAWYTDRGRQDCTYICVCSDNKAQRRFGDDPDSPLDLGVPACTDVSTVVRNVCRARQRQPQGLIVIFSTYQSSPIVSRVQQELRARGGSAMAHVDLMICDEAHRTTGSLAATPRQAKPKTGAAQAPGTEPDNEDPSAFVRVHDNDFIAADRRLYMTATPRVYGRAVKNQARQKLGQRLRSRSAADAVKDDPDNCLLASMDDERIFGPEIYRVSFEYAVEHKLLTDYKVIVLNVSEGDLPPELAAKVRSDEERNREFTADDTMKMVGVVNALSKILPGDYTGTLEADPQPMRRAVAFCGLIGSENKPGSSKFVARLFKDVSGACDKASDHRTVKVEGRHVDGAMGAMERNKQLTWLRGDDLNPSECRVLCNVRCLAEGVDVPALDAVIFLSARKSQVDVIQAVGRVMRNFRRDAAGGKKYGYIIVPVVVPEGVSPEDALQDNSRFATVWSVLNSLRSHDDSFQVMIEGLRFNHEPPRKLIWTKAARPGSLPRGTHGIGTDDPAPEHSDDARLASELLRHSELQYVKEMQRCVFSRVLDKVGERGYFESWGARIGATALKLTQRLLYVTGQSPRVRREMEAFVAALRRDLNDSCDLKQAAEMLAQHLVMKPVFDALFADHPFTAGNPVSQALQKVFDAVKEEGMTKGLDDLEKTYRSIKKQIPPIPQLKDKQELIRTLYDRFFSAAFGATIKQLGVVYTPVECVDFMLHSVEDVLRDVFHSSLSAPEVSILDPFTGTGTFIVRLLQSGLIKPEDLERKYKGEIHCNEILLLAYYIAAINIEATFHALGNRTDYEPFRGICLTDTFLLGTTAQTDPGVLNKPLLVGNKDRIDRELRQPIRVIVMNPPYSMGQRSANDNAANRTYPQLRARVDDTYGVASTATLKTALHDTYVQAVRWASDRLAMSWEHPGEHAGTNDGGGGIVAMISNNGWLDGNAQDGMRKCLAEEFDLIYVLNLRGNQRTSGELSRKEGGKIFGAGSRAGIAVTLLIRKPGMPETERQAEIKYYDIGDYLDQKTKLTRMAEFGSLKGVPQWTAVHPNKKHDWINRRGEFFYTFIPLGDKKNQPKRGSDTEPPLATFLPIYGGGLKTNRDAWCYNSSRKILSANIKNCIDFYNGEVRRYHEAKEEARAHNARLPVARDFVDYDAASFSWDAAQIDRDLPKGITYRFDDKAIRDSLYRPFYHTHVYFHRQLNNSEYFIRRYFPRADSANLVICVPSVGDNKPFMPLMADCLPDLHVNQTCQCFPRYYYPTAEERQRDGSQGQLFGGGERDRRDGIDPRYLQTVRQRYREASLTADDVFYYVYGLLHSADYRRQFAVELKKDLPRIFLVDSLPEFQAFVTAGRRLADLHLHFEPDPRNPPTPLPGVSITCDGAPWDGQARDSYELFQVGKMSHPRCGRQVQTDTVTYNDRLTVTGIPAAVYDYVVNGRAAVDWVLERQQQRTDPASGIANDPNARARELKYPAYLLDLLISVINLSAATVNLINELPSLRRYFTEGSQK